MQRELQDQEVSSLADGHRGSETEPRAWGCLGSSTPLSLREGLCPGDLEFVLAWSDACQKHFAEAKENFVQSLQTWPGSSCWVPGLKWGLPWREAEDECLPFFSLRDFLKFMARDCEAVCETSFHVHGSFESCLQSTEPGGETPRSLQGLDCSSAGDDDVRGQRGDWAGFAPGLVPTEPSNNIFGEDDGQRGAGQDLRPVLCRRSPMMMFPGNGGAGQDVRPVSGEAKVGQHVCPISCCQSPLLTLVAISWGGH